MGLKLIFLQFRVLRLAICSYHLSTSERIENWTIWSAGELRVKLDNAVFIRNHPIVDKIEGKSRQCAECAAILHRSAGTIDALRPIQSHSRVLTAFVAAQTNALLNSSAQLYTIQQLRMDFRLGLYNEKTKQIS